MIFTIPQPYLQRASGAGIGSGIGSYDDAPATDDRVGDDDFGGGNTGGDDDRGGNTGGGDDDRGGNAGGGDDDRGGNTGGGDDDRGGDDDFGGGDEPWAGNDCFDCFAELGGCDTFFTGGGMYDDVPGECPRTRGLYNNALQHCNQMVRYAGRTCPQVYSPEGYEFSFNYEDDFFGNDADDGFVVPTDFFGTSVIIMVVASRFPYTRMCIPQPFSTLHPPLTYAMRIMCALALTCHGVLLCRVLSCDCMR